MLLTIISFFSLLLILILAHEIGHFFTAKLFNVRVEEFGIFLPPRLLFFKKGDTIYSLNAIPLGGFNKLAGEDDPNISGSLSAKSIPVRLLVLGAGSLMNLILPILFLTIAFMVPHAEAIETVVVSEVASNSPAMAAGILPGDIIIAVNDVEITTVNVYSDTIKANLGQVITITIKKSNDKITTTTLTPRTNPPVGEGATGLLLGQGTVNKSYSIWKSIPMGIERYWHFLVLYKDGLVATIKGTVPFEVAGPVGIAQATGEVARMGLSPLLQFAALIGINLGLVNILPLPALDGGRIVFVLLEFVRRGKRVSPKVQQVVHSIGFLLLIGLILLVTYKDILRLTHGS